MKAYRERIFDRILREKLSAHGAVLVTGAKWCGKTTTATRAAASAVYLDDPKTRASHAELARIDPHVILAGPAPRLLDEWQLAPELWDAVRFEVDRAGEPGRFLLTGSSVPADLSSVSHSGTGRIARMRMRPMTLWESGDASGEISLSALFDGETPAVAVSPADLEKIAFLVCRGGWPQAVGLAGKAALRQAPEYVKAVCESDAGRTHPAARNPAVVRAVVRSLARLQGTAASAKTILADMAGTSAAIHVNTLYGHLDALAGSFVSEDMEAWCPNLRSKARLRTSPTRYFTDPSIAAAALRASPADLMRDLSAFGILFETMAVRDLRTMAEGLDGGVFHYLDNTGLECDCVVHLDDGRYGLAEIKLGGERLVEEGAKSLCRLESVLDVKRMPPPSFKLVLTAVGSYAFKRPEDGVFVCPLPALRP